MSGLWISRSSKYVFRSPQTNLCELQVQVQHFSINIHTSHHFILLTFRMPWRVRKWFYRYEIRLLTPDEYALQGKEETKRALEELKMYCESPDCNQWKLVSRLKSPTRYVPPQVGISLVQTVGVLRFWLNPARDKTNRKMLGARMKIIINVSRA